MAGYQPTIERFRELAEGGANLIPVYREVVADLETPVSAYLKIARGAYSFLLESVEGGERLARYSFMGTEPYRVLRTGPGEPDGDGDPLLRVQAELERFSPGHVDGLPRFLGGAVGYLAYECAHYFEPRVPVPAIDPHGLPEAVFLFTDSLLVFDHLKHRIQVVAHAHVDGDADRAYAAACTRVDELVARLAQPLDSARSVVGGGEVSAPTSNKTHEQYHAMVVRAKEYIVAGDVIQVVPSQRLALPLPGDPFDVYRSLRAINPSPYMYYLHLDDVDVVGASPEMLVRVEDGVVDTHPIAGTRRRGADAAEDAALEAELRGSEKERAEHIMLLDLGRNDIGRVAEPGTVQVTQMLEVERYSHVMHLVSHVTGRLADGVSTYDALRACFPAGTVSGAPKIRAMEIIAELEGERRGLYAGAVGYFSFSGNMDTAIGIRTMVVKDGTAYVQAGGGVVYDSDPEFERLETLQKADALIRAIADAQGQGRGA
ncbi:MAG: anthranilate synthase component I [Chloroflexi bacterium]|nr:anthranilate synthase component I [Chloroflexota bacterium]